MIAYKGFTQDLKSILGMNREFRFEPGKTYEEEKAKCANFGFHCAENPLCAMSYYSTIGSRYFVVRAEGDINQDGFGSRISCTKMTLVKELTRLQMGILACEYMRSYPERETESQFCKNDYGTCQYAEDFLIIRGKNPVGSGVKGSVIFLVQEMARSKNIKGIYMIEIDGTEYIEKKKYCIKGGEIVCVRKNS